MKIRIFLIILITVVAIIVAIALLGYTEEELPSIIYCGKLMITNESEVELTCNKLIIAPEYYNNVITCKSITVTDEIIFRYKGDVMEI